MPTVKVTPDFKIELPREFIQRVALAPGQELKVHLHGEHILLVPVRRPEQAPVTPLRRVDGIGRAG